MKIIKIKSPAKINIGLNIISKRDDGFHNLETIFYQIHDLFDELVFEKSDKLEFVLLEKNEELIENNIIVKAIKMLEQKVNKELTVKITLSKNIPIGAGLGGGSSDGASTLIAINKLYNLNLTLEELKTSALELGSDVPLFLQSYTSIGKGRGEDLTQIDLNIEYPILLVNPGIHISTKEAFANIIPKKNNFNFENISDFSISEWKGKAINDFENGVFQLYPKIAKIKKILNSNGALFSLMSGTGSTVYGIFKSVSDAEYASAFFPKSYFTFIGNR